VIGIKDLLELIGLEASNLLSLLCLYVSRREKVLSNHSYLYFCRALRVTVSGAGMVESSRIRSAETLVLGIPHQTRAIHARKNLSLTVWAFQK